jgi:hypothetical protein
MVGSNEEMRMVSSGNARIKDKVTIQAHELTEYIRCEVFAFGENMISRHCAEGQLQSEIVQNSRLMKEMKTISF